MNPGYDRDHLQIIDDIMDKISAIKLEDFPDEDLDASLSYEINGFFKKFHGGVSLDVWFRDHRDILRAEYEGPRPPIEAASQIFQVTCWLQILLTL